MSSNKGGKNYNKNKTNKGHNHNKSKSKQSKITKWAKPKNSNNKHHSNNKTIVTTTVTTTGPIDYVASKVSAAGNTIKTKLGINTDNNNQNNQNKNNYKQNSNNQNKHSHNTSSPYKNNKNNTKHNNKNNNKSYNTSHHHSSPQYKKTKVNYTHKQYYNNHSPNQNNNYSSDSSNYSNQSMGSNTSQSMNSSSSQSYNNNNKSNQYKLYPLPCKSSQRWQDILTVLTRKITNSTDLIKALYAVAGAKQKKKLYTTGLASLIDNQMSSNEKKIFFNQTLPFITQSALALPALFPGREIELLYSSRSATLEFTEDQVCSLLAMSFFGLHTWDRGNYFPRFNITNLFGYTESVYFEKLKCILHYFYILSVENAAKNPSNNNNNKKKTPIRTISITRHIPENHEYQILRNQYLKQNELKLCPFEFKLSGSIEGCDNSLQIDFANKYIGGGVLGSGCVQEEIRFLLNPECLVSLLLCESMKTNEAIAIVGTRQFSKYLGYGSGFRFNGGYKDQTIPRAYGDYYKYRNCILAIDAEKFYQNQLWMQYKENKMKRELLKAYAGFSVPTNETNLDENKENDKKLWIATGNWGCGVFGGDIELKCVIQWMAASIADRKIKYFAFGDKGCKYMPSFVQIMLKNNINVGQLWTWCCNYSGYRKNASIHNPNNIMTVFEYIIKQINNSIKNGNKWKLVAHSVLLNKKHNDVDPGVHKKEYKYETIDKKENMNDNRKKINVNVNKNENENNTDENGDTEINDIKRQDSFDDNDLIHVDIDSSKSGCGLQSGSDNDNNNNTFGDFDRNDKKKTTMGNSENQNSNATNLNKDENNNKDVEEDDDVDMFQK